MARLAEPPDISNVELHGTSKSVAEIVIRQFREHEVAPRLAKAIPASAVFKGLSEEQTRQLGSVCKLQTFSQGDRLVEQGGDSSQALLILSGKVSVSIDDQEVGKVGTGESLGEVSLLRNLPHTATATALEPVEAAALGRIDMESLVRRRPDIGLILYRNLAAQLGEKLMRADRRMMGLAE